MKTGTLDKMKFMVLKNRLQLPRYVVIGLLEGLWYLTATNAPEGDVGRFSDLEIAAWLEWSGDAGQLVEAFVGSGFLDRDDRFRLVVHGWDEHCPNHIANNLKRWGKSFAAVCEPTTDSTVETTKEPPKQSPSEVTPNLTNTNQTESNQTQPIHRARGEYSDEFENWWKCYPRREAKGAAWKAWPKAVASIQQAQDIAQPTAVTWLIETTKRFSESPKGKGEYVPHPATFLNEKRFDDDPQQWQRADSNGRHGSRSGPIVGPGQSFDPNAIVTGI